MSFLFLIQLEWYKIIQFFKLTNIGKAESQVKKQKEN